MFKSVYIPRTLQELSMEEVEKLKRDEQSKTAAAPLFGKLTGIPSTVSEPIEEKVNAENPSDSDDGEEKSEDDNESEDGEKKEFVSIRYMTKEQKKEHKKMVKEENREKRKTKIPKFVKKKAEKKKN